MDRILLISPTHAKKCHQKSNVTCEFIATLLSSKFRVERIMKISIEWIVSFQFILKLLILASYGLCIFCSVHYDILDCVLYALRRKVN